MTTIGMPMPHRLAGEGSTLGGVGAVPIRVRKRPETRRSEVTAETRWSVPGRSVHDERHSVFSRLNLPGTFWPAAVTTTDFSTPPRAWIVRPRSGTARVSPRAGEIATPTEVRAVTG